MDDKLNEDVNMLIVVKGICKANPAIMALVPQMELHLTTLSEKIISIKALAQRCGISIRGLYVVKSEGKVKLVSITDVGSAALRSLASATNDADLKAKAKQKAYQLEKLHKNDLISKSAELLALANLHSAALEDHGLEAADLTEWQSLLDAFTGSAETPRIEQEVHKSDLVTLKTIVADTLRWMRETMDDTAIAYKRRKPEFYQLYSFAREKHHQGHRKTDTGEEIVNPGEFVLDVLRGGSIVMAGFPIVPDVIYLIENLKETKLRYWAQATQVAPAAIPADSAVLAIEEDLQRKGSELGAPDKPYLFFGNDNTDVDGQVAINTVEE